MKKIVTVSLFILTILFSCDDVSDFLFETEHNVQIRSIDNGSVYKGDDKIPLTISFDREIVPEEFTVAIFDNLGKSWGETISAIPQAEDFFSTSLIVPGKLPPGKYIFHIRVFENDVEISFKEIIIFKVDGDYVIEQLYSLPHETNAEKYVQIKAVVRSPSGEDPFLRWSLHGTLLKEGYLSDGLNTLNWLSESENGLYAIKLEVFPESCDPSFRSTIEDTTEIIVTDQLLYETNSLGPDMDYSLLFHFSGDLYPSDKTGFEIVNHGVVSPESFSNILGYSLTAHTGLTATGMCLPIAEDKITPFSINGRAIVGVENSAGNILTIRDEKNTIISLVVNDSGYPELSINDQTSISLFTLFDMTDFTVSVIPGEDETEVRWYYNGINGGIDVLDTEIVTSTGLQSAILGGNDTLEGASVFFDELGIYIGEIENSTIDADQFYRVKKYLLGDNLISADGYDDLGNGFLNVEPGQEILLDSFIKTLKDIEFVVSMPEPAAEAVKDKWKLILRSEKGAELFSFDNNDTLREIDSHTGLVSLKIRFSLITNENSVEIKLKNNDLKNGEITDLNPGDKLSLFFETNVENKNKSLIDFFIIFTNIESLIPERVVAGEEEEKLL